MRPSDRRGGDFDQDEERAWAADHARGGGDGAGGISARAALEVGWKMAERRSWLMLTYTVPRHPTSKRVYVWRKLKRLGAVPLQDAAWVLPAGESTREQMRWLAAEIEELDGVA